MPAHDVIVVGASAGGVEALTQLVAGLPADLPTSLAIVMHIPATNVSLLPTILGRAGPLPAQNPRHHEPIRKSRIYVSPPDHHLLIQDGQLRLGRGPRENGHRPAIDSLFRSAAWHFGPRVVGVLLSGNLDDGTAGLLAIKRPGGVTLVQDPTESAAPGMPSSAIENGAADQVLPVADITAVLVDLAYESVIDSGGRDMSGDMEEETKIAEFDAQALQSTEQNLPPSVFASPECGGTLFEVHENELVRYRCRIGHTFSPETLAAEQVKAVDDVLWVAYRALKERAALARRMAQRMRERGMVQLAQRHEEQARDAESQAQKIRRVLLENSPQEERAESA
jgi:two-component system chemotaxis response regulator CheB